MTFVFATQHNGHLDAAREVNGETLTIRARDVRRERTGVHALITIGYGRTMLWSDTINADKGTPDRHNFANALYGTRMTPGKMPAAVVTEYPQDIFEHEFMLWSTALWGAWLGESSGTYVPGDEKPSAPPWAIPGLVMTGSTNIIAGDAGSGKSTLLRLACQSLNHGIDTIIPIQSAGAGIWVNAEESPEEHTRQLGNVNSVLGLPRTTPMFTLHARGMGITDLAQRLERAVKETKAEHVFVDSLSRLAQGANLNDNNTATLLIDSLIGLGCSVSWIGHTGHENSDRLSGSKHFENAARVMVLVKSRMSIGGVSPELERGVRARVYKANGAVQTSPLFWTFNYHRQYGLDAATLAEPEDWPVLRCGQYVGQDGTCGRKTWDGVNRAGEVRCSRHRDGEDSEA